MAVKNGRARGIVLDARGNVAVSPELSRRRHLHHELSSVLYGYPGIGGYKGARSSRDKGGWNPPTRSANADLMPDRRALVDRSWDLERNDPIASGILRTFVSNVIGSGIRVESRVDGDKLGLDEARTRELNHRIDDHWKRWVRQCDFAGNLAHSLNWYEMQGLGMLSVLGSGECYLFPRYRRSGDYSLAIHLVDEARVFTPGFTRDRDENCVDGIRVNPDTGEEEGIYVHRRHPGEDHGWSTTQNDWKYVPAINRSGRPNYWHIYKSKRVGQSKGVPVLAPVIDYFRRVDDYFATEFMQAQIANLFTLWITQPDPWQFIEDNTDAEELGVLNTIRRNAVSEMEAGALNVLQPGEDIRTAQNPHPSQNFDKFIDAMLVFIGAGLGLPRELVTRDFRFSNFSNTKAALIEARALFDGDQRFFTSKFCEPVRGLFVEMLFLMGELPSSYRLYPEAYQRSAYLPSGWKDLDRLNDIKARTQAWDSGHTTMQSEYAAQGDNWEEKLDQWEIEKKRVYEINMKYPSPEAKQAMQPESEPASEPGGAGGGQERGRRDAA